MLASYKAAQEGGRILYVNFTTVSDYFWLLRAACECLAACGPRAVLYLAAAVSDFYVPSNQMVCILEEQKRNASIDSSSIIYSIF